MPWVIVRYSSLNSAMPQAGASLAVQSRISVNRSMTSTTLETGPARNAGHSRGSAIGSAFAARRAPSSHERTGDRVPPIRQVGLAMTVPALPQLLDSPLDLRELVEPHRARFVPGHVDGALVDHALPIGRPPPGLEDLPSTRPAPPRRPARPRG